MKTKHSPYTSREVSLYIPRNGNLHHHHGEPCTTRLWVPPLQPSLEVSGSHSAPVQSVCTYLHHKQASCHSPSAHKNWNHFYLQMRNRAQRHFPQTTGDSYSDFLLPIQCRCHRSALPSCFSVFTHILGLWWPEFCKPTMQWDCLRCREYVSRRTCMCVWLYFLWESLWGQHHWAEIAATLLQPTQLSHSSCQRRLLSSLSTAHGAVQ